MQEHIDKTGASLSVDFYLEFLLTIRRKVDIKDRSFNCFGVLSFRTEYTTVSNIYIFYNSIINYEIVY